MGGPCDKYAEAGGYQYEEGLRFGAQISATAKVAELVKYRKALEQIASLKVLQPEVGVAVGMARRALGLPE